MVPSFAQDSIGVQITIEDNLERIHQDFADMALTKPLPKSLLTSYDLRDPLNRLVHDVIAASSLLKGRVDGTSSKLSIKSRHICLSNWVRNLVKGAIATDYFIADEDVPKFIHEGLSTKDEVDRLRDDLVYLVNSMTQHIPALKQIAAIDPVGPEANKVPDLREEVLATTAVGLGISGMVLRIIRTEVTDQAKRRELIDDLYRKVNWLRSAKPVDPVWVGGGILDGGGSIKASRSNIFTSTAQLVSRIGLPINKKMQKYLKEAAA
jgi:hypothetical protein